MKKYTKQFIKIIIGMILTINLVACGAGSETKAVDSAVNQLDSVNKAAYLLKDIRATYDDSSKTLTIYPIFDEDLIYAAAVKEGYADQADVFIALFKGTARSQLKEELVDPIQKKYLDSAGITAKIISE